MSIHWTKTKTGATVAACKRAAAWSIKTGGPRLDARIEEVAR